MAAKKCTAKRRDGEPCGAWALLHKDFCIAHDHESRAVMRSARRKGGATHAAATRRRPRGAIAGEFAGSLADVPAGSWEDFVKSLPVYSPADLGATLWEDFIKDIPTIDALARETPTIDALARETPRLEDVIADLVRKGIVFAMDAESIWK